MTGGARKQIIVGITGASGAAYARRLVQCLCAGAVDVHLVVSPNGRRLLVEELGISEVTVQTFLGEPDDRLTIHPYRDVGSKLGSGSFRTDGMIVCPCSMNTLGAIASGLGVHLPNRAGAVTRTAARRRVVRSGGWGKNTP